MSAKNDIEGKRFGHLFVTGISQSSKDGRAQWVCKCDCGKVVITSGKRLINGNTKSCGCARVTAAILNGKKNVIHGKTKTPTWNSWSNMRDRCFNPNAVGYEYYGGRGISICDRWNSFDNFLSDMGERPAFCTIDRINPDGNYHPENCRWSTAIQQANNKRNNRRFGGKTAAEIARELGTNYVTTRKRLIREESANQKTTVSKVRLPAKQMGLF